MGLAQAVALFPGISRSGATISAGLALGLAPSVAVRFAFLMSLPVILGGGLFEAVTMVSEGAAIRDLPEFLAGAVVAGACAWAAVVLVFGAVRRGKLSYYAGYCFVIGATAVLAELVRAPA